MRVRPLLRRRGRDQVPGWVIVAGGLVALLLMRAVPAEPDAAAAAPTHDAAPVAAPAAALAAPAPYSSGPSGCVLPDPTSKGCLTGTAAHGLAEIDRVFGGYRGGPRIRSAGCWDAHSWNPSSDHPKGRACDLYTGPAGQFAAGTGLDHGWELANWLRANADALRVRYVIWQGRIWTAGRPDVDGWGRPYTGGGVYDPRDPVGGHFDHVHVSFQPA